MAYSTPLSFTRRDKLTDPFFPQPKTPARLHPEPATTRNKSLTIFHKFSELPKELQHKVWSVAFFNSPALHDWIKVDWQSPAAAEAYYFGGEDPKTDFWNWSPIGPFPKSIGLRTADRRLHLLISFDSGIPALLQACRSSRETALREFKGVLSETGFAINLTALPTNTAVFDELLQDMKMGDSQTPPHNTFSSRPLPLLQHKPQSSQPAPLLVNINTAPRRFRLT